jgi:WD40 repeat protein
MKGTADDSLRLSKVFGITSMHNSNIATCSGAEGVFYAAGSVAVRYFPHDNEQKGFYEAAKAISCMCVSFDGRYLALGERGHLPNVVVWDVVKMEKLVTLSGHKHGVGCVKFSPDDRYLVSVGFKHDKQLIIWDWKTGKKLSTQKLGNKVYSLSFHMFGDYFVTGGDRHLKWWTISEVLEGESICIEGKPACIIEEQKTSIFVDIACGSYHCDGKVYCITSTANLCIFNEERMVEKWITLNCKIAYSLELFLQQDSPGLLVVGGANGVIQAFSPKTLELLADLPLPAPITTPQKASDSVKYPAVYGVRQIHGTDKDPIPKLMSFYANHYMQIWDISDLYQIMSVRTTPAHFSCVWDLQCVDTATMNTMNTSILPHVMNHSNKLPDDTFITCSSDNSIRFWNTTVGQGKTTTEKSTVSTTSTATSTVMNPTGDMLHAFQLHADPEEEKGIRNSRLSTASTATGLSMTQEKGANEFDLAYGIPDLEIPDRIQSTFSPRVIAIHPWGHQIVCGDKSGKLLFYNLQTMELVKTIQAHSAEVLTLAYSSPMITYDDGKTWSLYHHDTDGIEASNPRNSSTIIVLLASAGRDRLIHVFNTIDPQVNLFNTRAIPNIINNLCTYIDPIDTLDHHSSSVTMVKFTHDGKKMISTSGDKTMIVYSVHGMGITKLKSIATPLGTINGLVVDVTNKFLVTSGQDKKITIWNLHNGKPMRSYKHQEYLNTELYKVDLDSSGCYLVTCSFEKQISLIDFFSGEVIAQVAGHSEMITNVKFTPDNMHVISIGGDGCIMLWKMSKLIVRTIKDRLIELYTNAQRKNTRAMIRQNNLQSTATLSTANAASPPKQPIHSSESVPSSAAANAGSSGQTTEENTVPKGSLSQLKSKLSVRSSGTSLSTSTTSTSTTNGGSGIKKLNRWEMKLQQEQQESGGYSLFGKKISAQSQQQDKKLNKFTLELTSTVLPEAPVATNASSDQQLNLFMPPPPPTRQEENSQADDQLIGSPNARALEAEDSVMHALSMSSDEDDDSMMDDIDGAALIEEVEQAMLDSTIDGDGAIVSNHDDEVMTKSQEKLNDMEKTAKDLENWLEDMVRDSK